MSESMDLFSSARRDELVSLISRYQNSYYNGEAEISDEEFDALWDELKHLDPANPILHRVGADSGNFAKATHRIPMGSQEKAANPDEFLAWTEKHLYDEYLVEYKLDGASIELQYNDGVFFKAVTRGNGVTGDDITSNALKMQGVLTSLIVNGLSQPFTGGIRGEVIMTHDIHRGFFAEKANCRNAANGIMKRKDGVGSEHLQVVCYDAFFENHLFRDEVEKMEWLASCGFKTVPLAMCHSPQEVIEYRAKVMEERVSLPYDIDGLVVKERRIDMEDMARSRPDRQIAFKFNLEEAASILRGVEWSESGSTYTPVALFDPVELAGTTVRRASLANPNTIRTLGIQLGSHVIVTKRGEIIPKIEAVIPHENGADGDALEDIPFPERCMSCGSELVDEGTRLYCPNNKCPKRILHRLEKWVDVLDIRDLGDSLIRALFDSGRVRSVTALYTLTEEDLAPYFLNEESLSKDKKSLGAERVVKSIHRRLEVPVSTFIAGFDIEGIGETLMEKLSSAGFDTLEKLCDASVDEIAAVNGFGEITALALVNGLQENISEMRHLVESGAVVLKKPDSGGLLAGKTFCFTGELSIKRAEAEKMVKAHGGSVKSSVGKGLSFLVTNDTNSGSSKNKKALSLGIPVIDEAEFMKMIGSWLTKN